MEPPHAVHDISDDEDAQESDKFKVVVAKADRGKPPNPCYVKGKHIKVGVAIIIHNNCVLLAKRKEGPLMDLWEFPGGKTTDTEECPMDCTEREVQEELGIQINIRKHIAGFLQEYDFGTFCICAHMVDLVSDINDIELHAHKEIKWVGLDELQYVDGEFVPSSDRIIAALLSELKDNENRNN